MQEQAREHDEAGPSGRWWALIVGVPLVAVAVLTALSWWLSWDIW